MRFTLCIALFLLSIPSFSQDGVLDTLFGDDSSTVLSYSDTSARGKTLVVLDDNSIIIGVNNEQFNVPYQGNRGFYVYKLTPDGVVDQNFGPNGFLFFPNQNSIHSYISSLTKTPSNEILMHCSVLEQHTVIKINEYGDILTSFNVPSNIQGNARSLGIQSTGKIIVAGQYYDDINVFYQFHRFDSEGSIDSSFGFNGTSIIDLTPYRVDKLSSILIQSDDKIVIAGNSFDSAAEPNAVVSRVNENGTLDTSFGDNGQTITLLTQGSDPGEFIDIQINSTGELIAGGNAYYEGGTGGFAGVIPTIVKYDETGTLDTAFGVQGRYNFNTVYGANDRLRSVQIQADDKIIIGGSASYPYPFEQTNFYVTRLTEDGALDTTFGINGKYLTSFGTSNSNFVSDIKFQNDNLLVFGTSKAEGNTVRTAILIRLINVSLSIPDHRNIATIVYPNPSSGEFQISCRERIHGVAVFNQLGQLVYRRNGNLTGLDIASNRTGFYQIVIQTEKGTIVQKLVVE